MLRRIAFAVVLFASLPLLADETVKSSAEAAYRAEKWSEALPLYQKITAAEPSNGQAWYRTGVSLHHLGRLDEAIAAYLRAADLGFAPPFTAYNIAAAYALKKDASKAFEWLDKAVSAGFRDEKALATDSDLDSLRSDDRFERLQSSVEKKAHPCHAAEYRALDFWVGEWNVRDTRSGQTTGTSSISRILDDCVVLEQWTGARGLTGKSFNTIDPANGKWRQTWTDSAGEIYDFVGEPASQRMIFTRETVEEGKPARIRMTLSKLPTGEVRQLSEKTTDGGKSWSVEYDFTYKAK